MIELYQFRPKFGAPNLSPFCIKVEAWLKMAGLEYSSCHQDDPRKAPLGKLPVIKDGSDTVPDSSLIIQHLEQKYSINLDAHLSDEERAVSHAFQRMMEERLYWAIVHNRWLGKNWPRLKQEVFSVLPPIIRDIVPVLVQNQLRRDMKGHGIGRHSEDTIYAFAFQDIDALAAYLADKSFFMGDKLSNVDAVLFGFLCCIIKVDLDNPLKAHAMQYDNLVSYQERLGKEFFSEYYK